MDQELYLKFQELQDRIEEFERDKDRLKEELQDRIEEFEYEDNRQKEQESIWVSLYRRLGDQIYDIK